MGKVVENQTADGDLFDVKHPAGLGQMLQWRVVRMERQRNKSLEAVRLILQRAEF